MKKILSIVLTTAMLVSLLAVNVSALVPTAQDKTIDLSVKESAITEVQTYSDVTSNNAFNSPSYDSAAYAIVNEDPADVGSNLVKEIKYSSEYDDEGNMTTLPAHSASQLNDGAQNTNILSNGAVIPETYMVEFDVCAKNNTTGLIFARRGAENKVQAALGIKPDTMVVDTWYTYRLYIDESAYRATLDNANLARANFLDGAKAYRKLRGSDAAFEDVTSSLINVTSGNGAMGFNLNATNHNVLRSDIDRTKDTVGNMVNTVYQEAFTACYQLDNIGVYNYTIPEDYEIVQGVINTYDMESWKNEGTAVTFESEKEADGNTYVKVSVGTDDAKKKNASWSFGSYFDLATTETTPDMFTFSVDVNNVVLGAGLTFEIHGDRESDDVNTFVRRSILIESDSSRLGQWYTYRFICADKVNGSAFDIKVYRRPRGSEDAWEEVAYEISSQGINKDEEDVFLSAGTGSGANRHRKWRFGLWGNLMSAYDVNAVDENGFYRNAEAVWYVDNVQFTDSAAVSGIINEADGTIDAELYIAGAAKESKAFIAIYDGDKFVGAGTALVDGEGWVNIIADGYQEGYTAKLFVWDWDGTNVPLLREALDITELL